MKHLLIMCFIFFNTFCYSFEITPGMKAHLNTVVSGNKIEEVDILIIDKTVDEALYDNEMYVFKLLDERVKKIGGIAEGMSGSPVFMNGNIIGAVAYAIRGNKNVGLILPLSNIPKEKIGTKYLPGMSVTISPTRGELLIKNSGTLTYSTENGGLYIYSHSLNNAGNIKYFINQEEKVFLLENTEIPFKLSSTADEIGYIYNDTKLGLEGRVAEIIPSYAFEISVDDNREIKDLSFEMIKNKNTLSYYLEKSIETSLIKLSEKSEYKFADYSMEILSEDGNVIFRDQNAVIAEAGILGSLSNTISNEILNVVDNRFKYINFNEIKLRIKLRDESKIIYIEDVNFEKKVYTPGERLEFEVTYLIHQVGRLKRKFSLKIPPDFKIGNVNAEVSINTGNNRKEVGNLIDYLYNIENSIKNNEVMVKLKNQEGETLLEEKLKFDYYVISDRIYNQDIIIDSFEARSND